MKQKEQKEQVKMYTSRLLFISFFTSLGFFANKYLTGMHLIIFESTLLAGLVTVLIYKVEKHRGSEIHVKKG